MEKTVGYIPVLRGHEIAERAINTTYMEVGVPMFKTREEAKNYGQTLIDGLTVVAALTKVAPPEGARVEVMEVFKASVDNL